jgi:glutathione S-transferase
MITIYHVPHSRSLRVVWLMEELGEEYRVERVSFPTPAAYRAVSPLGTVPAIEDDSVPGGIRMTESIAILQYLTGRRLVAGDETARALTVGPLPDPAAYAEHLNLLHFGEADLSAICTGLFRGRMAARAAGTEAPDPPNRIDRLAGRLAFLEDKLADGREWITGASFTIADISIGYALGFAAFLGLDGMFGPGVAAYWQRLRARPALQRTMAA